MTEAFSEEEKVEIALTALVSYFGEVPSLVVSMQATLRHDLDESIEVQVAPATDSEEAPASFLADFPPLRAQLLRLARGGWPTGEEDFDRRFGQVAHSSLEGLLK